MQHKKLYGLLMVLIAVVFLVQANQSDDVATTTITGDTIAQNATLEMDSTLSTDVIPVQKDTDAIEVPSDDDQAPALEEDKIEQPDIFQGLEPSLPGPKPEGGNLGPSSSQDRGENWERACTTIACTHTIYSYQKYYQQHELWQQINEQFYSSSCQNGYDFCVVDNLYQIHMRSYPDTTNAMLFTFNGIDFKFKPHAITFATNTGRQNIGSIQRSPVQVTHNRAQYPLAFTNNFDMQFTYLPRMFKEDLIIRTKEGLPLANISQNSREITFDVEFTLDVASSTQILIDNQVWDKQTTRITMQPIEIKQGNTSFYLAQPLAYDARGVTIPLMYALENRQNILYLTLKTSYDWLMNTTRVYPVIIDPTITLDYTSITWDGYLVFDSAGDSEYPGRNGATTYLPIGDLDNAPNPGFTNHRADLDWNIASLPDTADIINVDLTVYVEKLDSTNDEFRFYHMVGGNAHHPTTDPGNAAFYDDLTDGANYLNYTVSSGGNTINLTVSASLKNDLKILLVNGTDEWSLGMRAEETGASGIAESRFTSSEGTLANRPSLTILYEPLANETEGDAAIQQGITNALGSNVLMHDTQQLSTRNTSNTQELGRFDEVAQSTNSSKRWGINYVTEGESFTNMNNLSTVVYILELANLTTAQITQQVQIFIQGTL